MLIEGYFFEVGGRDIFYVKGIVNPPGGVIGFPKYIKDPSGDRINRNGERYRKIPGIEDEIRHILKFYQGFMRYDDFFLWRNTYNTYGSDIKGLRPYSKGYEYYRASKC